MSGVPVPDLATSLLPELAAELVGGAGGIVAGSVLGFILPGLFGLVGFPGAPDPNSEVLKQLNAIQQQLNEIQASLGRIAEQLKVIEDLIRQVIGQAAINAAFQVYITATTSLVGPTANLTTAEQLFRALSTDSLKKGKAAPKVEKGTPLQGNLVTLIGLAVTIQTSLNTIAAQLVETDSGLIDSFARLLAVNIPQIHSAAAPSLVNGLYLNSIWTMFGRWFALEVFGLLMEMEILHLPANNLQPDNPNYTLATIIANDLNIKFTQQFAKMPTFTAQSQIPSTQAFILDQRLVSINVPGIGVRMVHRLWQALSPAPGFFVGQSSVNTAKDTANTQKRFAPIKFKNNANSLNVVWAGPTADDYLSLGGPGGPAQFQYLMDIGFYGLPSQFPSRGGFDFAWLRPDAGAGLGYNFLNKAIQQVPAFGPTAVAIIILVAYVIPPP